MNPESGIFQYLDTVGDGTGTTNAVGDYSLGQDFKFVSAGNARLYRMLIAIEDTAGIQQTEYGNIAALTNGWELKCYDHLGVETLDLTAGVVVKTNAQIGRTCYDVNKLSWESTPTNESVLARWTFNNAGGPLELHPGCELRLELNDDFTGLIEHYFLVQGYYVA